MKSERLGDKMPVNRNVKWGAMNAGESHLSDEWHDMHPSSGHMSEKYVEQNPSPLRMSDKWCEINAGESKFSDEFHEMKQEGRMDPYSMSPSEGNRAEASMKKQSKNDMKNGGHGRYTISGSEGQSGKGL